MRGEAQTLGTSHEGSFCNEGGESSSGVPLQGTHFASPFLPDPIGFCLTPTPRLPPIVSNPVSPICLHFFYLTPVPI